MTERELWKENVYVLGSLLWKGIYDLFDEKRILKMTNIKENY